MNLSLHRTPFCCASCCRLALIMILLVPGGLMAQTNSLLDRKLTVEFQNVTLETAVRQLAMLADVRFAFKPEDFIGTSNVRLTLEDATLRDVLHELFASRDINYKVYEAENSITLSKRIPQPRSNDRVSMSGTVRNAAGELMTGVSVYIKGTSDGTMTDAAGRFSLSTTSADKLIFSFIGYLATERDASEASDVVLDEDITALKEIVLNAGYWQVKTTEQTGNIARITAKDLEYQPVYNPLLGLTARIPGVIVQQVSGVPGSGVRLQVRGQNSLRNLPNDNGNLPLYIIDGVPIDANPIASSGQLLTIGGIDPLSTINSANIESIEILKDADATSIYGSRGSNGVVLITTKRGQPGRIKLDVQAYNSVGRVSNRMDLLRTSEYLAMRNEAFELDEIDLTESDYDINGVWDTSRNTDWQKRLLGGTAHFQDIQTSLSGGNATTSFRFGLGVHQESTVFRGDFGYRKIMGNLNVTHQSSDDRFRFSVTINYGRDNNELFNRNVVDDALTLAPNAPLYDANGQLDWTGYNVTRPNPVAPFKISHNTKMRNLITNASVSYELLKGLRLGSSFGYTDSNSDQLIKTPQASMDPVALTDSKSLLTDVEANTWIAEPQLSYKRELLGGRLDITLGTTWQESYAHNFEIAGTGFLSDDLLGNVRAARSITINRDEKVQYRYNAVFGRLGYIWKDRYLINLTARRDGSSRFGADNQFGNFGAVAGAWIFSQETFMNTVSWLSFGKLRTSYGTSGSDYVGNYGYLNTYTPASPTYGGTPVLNTTGLANPDFGWEVSKKFEAAIDLGFIRDRIQLSTSYYRHRSSNQLVGYPLPAITGFSSVQYNLDATVENTGWEFELRTINLEKRWKWTTSVNLTIPRNSLVSYPGLASSSYADVYVVGEALTINKRYEFIGVNPVTGLYEVRDVDENESLTGSDRTQVVDLGRTLYGGVHNILSFKGVSLDMMLEFVQQDANAYQSLFPLAPGMMSNQSSDVLRASRWRTENDQANLQRFSTSATSYEQFLESNANASDASFIRLRTISLAWQLPVKFIRKAYLANASVYIQGQNLLTFSNYKGLNPEFPSAQLPPLRTLTIGLQLSL